MFPLSYYTSIFTKYAPDTARGTGRSTLSILLGFAATKFRNNPSWSSYTMLRLYEQSAAEQKEYLTASSQKRLMKKLEPDATVEDKSYFNSKYKFNCLFSDFIHRDWIYLPESTPEEIHAFLARHDSFLLKPVGNYGGHGIQKFCRGEFNEEEFIKNQSSNDCLLEEFILQHPDLSAVNPTSVNTIRVQTARKGDKVLLLGAALRSGAAGSITDNFTGGGGYVFPLDMESGIVTGPGIRGYGPTDYYKHPDSGVTLPGLQIPHWELLKDIAVRAARVSPRVTYVGWDFAITSEGVELVEGNALPGMELIQVGRHPAYTKLAAFVKEK